MKLKKLKINSHYHLKDLEFDFTYPKGHQKEGLPLDKICFVGQSATGKTKILNAIFNELSFLLHVEIVNQKSIFHSSTYNRLLDGEVLVSLTNSELHSSNEGIYVGNNIFDYSDSGGGMITYLFNDSKSKVIRFDANYVSSDNIRFFNTNPLDIVFGEDKSKLKEEEKSYDFKEALNDRYILNILESFLNFRQKYDQKVRELLLKGYISDLEKFNKDFKSWQIDNPNPIDDFSDKFDVLLNKLYLEIDRTNVEYPIPFRNKATNEIIPINSLSTGTKGLLLYMLPLYQINTNKSIILLDEPERSLYPDIQMELMDFFRNVSPNSQIITATHSPFIAASFEPEERFILYFNEDGKVEVRNGSSPIGDDPNDILFNDFGINYINRYGQKAYAEYTDLKQKIYFEKDEVKKKKYSEKLEELGEKYNF